MLDFSSVFSIYCRAIRKIFILFAGIRLVNFWPLSVKTLLEYGHLDQEVKGIVFMS